jgi:hypothetical protein
VSTIFCAFVQLEQKKGQAPSRAAPKAGDGSGSHQRAQANRDTAARGIHDSNYKLQYRNRIVFAIIPTQVVAVGGAMRSEYHPGRYWVVLGCSFICGAAFFLFGAALIFQAWLGHGSHAGNILRIGLAVFSVFIGFFFLAVGTLYRASFDESRDR